LALHSNNVDVQSYVDHVVLGEVSLDIIIWPYLVLSWIGGRRAIGRS